MIFFAAAAHQIKIPSELFLSLARRKNKREREIGQGRVGLIVWSHREKNTVTATNVRKSCVIN